MKTYIKNSISLFLEKHPKAKEWLWFIVLWFLGLATVTILTYPIKLMIKALQ
jgi:hypothetical protein